MDEKEVNQGSEKDTNNSQKNSLSLHPENPLTAENKLLKTEEAPADKVEISMDELKAMLKKIKADEPDSLLQSKVTEKYF